MSDPQPSWHRYHFAAAVLPPYAALYPTLRAGRHYPVMVDRDHVDQQGNHWLAPARDPATWVLVLHAHVDFIELERGDAWEGGDIQPLDFPTT